MGGRCSSRLFSTWQVSSISAPGKSHPFPHGPGPSRRSRPPHGNLGNHPRSHSSARPWLTRRADRKGGGEPGIPGFPHLSPRLLNITSLIRHMAECAALRQCDDLRRLRRLRDPDARGARSTRTADRGRLVMDTPTCPVAPFQPDAAARLPRRPEVHRSNVSGQIMSSRDETAVATGAWFQPLTWPVELCLSATPFRAFVPSCERLFFVLSCLSCFREPKSPPEHGLRRASSCFEVGSGVT